MSRMDLEHGVRAPHAAPSNEDRNDDAADDRSDDAHEPRSPDPADDAREPRSPEPDDHAREPRTSEASGAAALFAGLNPPQIEAVSHGEGPLLILAGPGSGKTRVITRRIAHLVTALGVPPWRILAITFTNKAAREMRERVESLLPGVEGLWISTFHSMCARIRSW